MSHVLSVTPALPAEQPLIANLFQLYTYDFSELEPAGSERFEVGADGRFEDYPYLPAYWTEADRWPLLIRLGDAVVGFALVNTHSHLTGGPVERNMAEFFVLRKHRRGGLATRAVAQVLKRHPGRWEVAVAARNTSALAFWPRALAAAGVSGLERLEGDGEHWTGPIWTFVAG